MRNSVRTIVLAAFLPALVLVSCGGRSRPEEPLAELVMPVIRVDSAKCHEFAKELERAFAFGDYDVLSQAVNMEMCWDRVAYGMQLPDQEKLDFINKMPAGFGLGERYGEMVQDGGSFRFLRIRWDDGHPRALFRLEVAEEGFTYFDFLLGDRAGAEVVIYDVFFYSIGEFFSTATRRMMMKSKGSLLKELLGRESHRAYTAIDSIKTMMSEEDYQGALAYSNTLPPGLRKERLIQTLRVTAAMKLTPAEYEQAIAEFQGLFAGDPSADLMLIPQYELIGKYDSALAAIDRLDRAVGGDPYLNTTRGNVLMKASRFDDARKAIAAFGLVDSTTSEPDAMFLDLALAEHDHDETVRLLDLLTTKWGMEWSIDRIESSEVFAEFVTTDAYARWKERQE